MMVIRWFSTTNMNFFLGDLPCTLKLLLTSFFEKRFLQSSSNRPICHAISTGSSTSLMMHSRYGSRYFVEKLSQFGFCKRWQEILRCEKNAALTSCCWQCLWLPCKSECKKHNSYNRYDCCIITCLIQW